MEEDKITFVVDHRETGPDKKVHVGLSPVVQDADSPVQAGRLQIGFANEKVAAEFTIGRKFAIDLKPA